MGRRKVEIKRIQEKSCRQVAFCKRRKGLLKKAKALSTLCDVAVAVVIFSNSGKLYEFSNTNSLTGILQRYESHVEAEKEISAEILVEEHSKYSRFMTMGELLQTAERHLEETNVDGLAVTDLVHLENELRTALIQARSRKVFLHSFVTSPYRNCSTNTRSCHKVMRFPGHICCLNLLRVFMRRKNCCERKTNFWRITWLGSRKTVK
ncbi:truncated transcription factor CAULIFLOWER D-like isoform X1 [Lycium barbarum]|uniref:truncated transcription factor CAULIFLOWER D-like isoform X1 n=1 Tax=Lycium barbarum TaxID=112863 RepID=UPI00293E05B6|nr:truncated transcription factor CAULIFLOWER D-like isoform X1 [Lycium barbarum]